MTQYATVLDELLALRSENAGLRRDSDFWKSERDKAVNHATTYGPEIDRLRAALNLGRECVVESFQHAKTHDDTMLAEARLRDIDDALDQEKVATEIARLRALLLEAIPHIEGTQNTTSMETFEAAGTLLEKVRAALEQAGDEK